MVKWYHSTFGTLERRFDSCYRDQRKKEGNAAGLVLRLALKTRFREIGWGSTPLPSAKNNDKRFNINRIKR
jgi:hypothetical protein